MKVGDFVECTCAPGCARAWVVEGAIEGPSHRPPKPHGPCVRGTIVKIDRRRDAEALIAQEHGGIKYYTPIGFGQYAARDFAAEVWASLKGLRKAVPRSGEDDRG